MTSVGGGTLGGGVTDEELLEDEELLDALLLSSLLSASCLAALNFVSGIKASAIVDNGAAFAFHSATSYCAS